MITIFAAESAGIRGGESWEDPRFSRRPSPREMPEIRSARSAGKHRIRKSGPSRLYHRNALSSRRAATRSVSSNASPRAARYVTRSIAQKTNPRKRDTRDTRVCKLGAWIFHLLHEPACSLRDGFRATRRMILSTNAIVIIICKARVIKKDILSAMELRLVPDRRDEIYYMAYYMAFHSKQIPFNAILPEAWRTEIAISSISREMMSRLDAEMKRDAITILS